MRIINLKSITITLLLLLITTVFIKTAWLSDDAYISFRAVDNFINGHGPVWNINERVWVYTHPLWFFLISLFEFLFQNIYFVSIFISLALLVATFYLLIKTFPSYFGIFLSTLILIGSKVVVDYSSSGLENPLSHLLIAIFLICILKKYNLYFCIFIGGLIVLNRMDHLLIILPSLLYLSFTHLRKIHFIDFFIKTIIALLPLLLWELFAFIYYGSFFPNTAYAKLNTGISRTELLTQGMFYFYDFLKNDPVGFFIFILGIFLPLVRRITLHITISMGLALYLLYILYIGGDFMSGRFFSTPIVAALIILLSLLKNTSSFKSFFIFFIALLLTIPNSGRTYLSNSLYQNHTISEQGVADERGFYFQHSGLIKQSGSFNGILHPWAEEGKSAKQQDLIIVIRCYIGFYGYFSDNKTFILDGFSLSNSFLVYQPIRLPWRIGHYERYIPKGYVEYLYNNNDDNMQPIEKELISLISKVNTLPLFSFERLKAILKLRTKTFEIPLLEKNQYFYFDSPEYRKVAPKHKCLGVPGSPNIRIL